MIRAAYRKIRQKRLLFAGFSWIKILLITIAAAVVIFGSTLAYTYYRNGTFNNLGQLSNKSQSSTSQTAAYKLPSGSQTYRFSHGSEVKGPKISTVVIDPLDPQNGATQTITLDLESESPVTKVTIVIVTDKQEKNIDLKLIEGDSKKGKYGAAWQVNDTYDTKYAIRYDLRSETATYDETMFIR